MRNGRDVQRGKPLDADCYKAHISKHENGPNDNRCFCYGLIDCSNDEYLPKCRKCGAWAWNAKKPEESEVSGNEYDG